MNKDNMTWEWCPHCDSEVELKCEMKPQVCPVCGKWICPCSLCDGCKKDCEIEKECRRLNNE